MEASKTPKTGRLGQWVKAMEGENMSQSAIEEVMQDADQFTSTSSPAKKAEWIKNVTSQIFQLQFLFL